MKHFQYKYYRVKQQNPFADPPRIKGISGGTHSFTNLYIPYKMHIQTFDRAPPTESSTTKCTMNTFTHRTEMCETWVVYIIHVHHLRYTTFTHWNRHIIPEWTIYYMCTFIVILRVFRFVTSLNCIKFIINIVYNSNYIIWRLRNRSCRRNSIIIWLNNLFDKTFINITTCKHTVWAKTNKLNVSCFYN